MPVFILGRTLQGLGGGAVGTVAYLAINRAYPDALRARMLALLSSAWVLPALVGPLVAGLVASHFSWHAVFLGILPLLAVVAVLTWPALGRLPGEGTPFDARRARLAVRAAVGAVLVLTALQQGAPLVAVASGVLGLAALVPALGGLLPPGTFRVTGPLQAGMATRFLLAFSFLGSDALVPLALSELRGFSVTAAGLVLTCAALSWSVGSTLQARLDEAGGRGGRSGRARLGFALVAAAIGLLAITALVAAVPAPAAALAWAAGGLGMGLAFPAHTLVVFEHAPAGQEGRVSGTLQLVDVLGTALSAGTGGALVATLGTRGGLGAACALTVAAAGCGVLVAGRLRGPGSRA